MYTPGAEYSVMVVSSSGESSGADPTGTRAAIPARADSAVEIRMIARVHAINKQKVVYFLECAEPRQHKA